MKKFLVLLAINFFIINSLFASPRAIRDDASWPFPLQISAELIAFDGCCLTFRVSLSQLTGDNWYLLWSGTYSEPVDGSNCCSPQGMHSDPSGDNDYYEAYMTDDEVRTATDNAVDEAVINFLNTGKTIIERDEEKRDQVLIYPNPAKSKITVDFVNSETSSSCSYRIISSTGQIVDFNKGQLIKHGKLELLIRQLENGVYYLELVVNPALEKYVKKFIIEN